MLHLAEGKRLRCLLIVFLKTVAFRSESDLPDLHLWKCLFPVVFEESLEEERLPIYCPFGWHESNPTAVPLPCCNWLPSLPFHTSFRVPGQVQSQVNSRAACKTSGFWKGGPWRKTLLIFSLFLQISFSFSCVSPLPQCLPTNLGFSLSFFFFSFFSLWFPQLLTLYFYSPLVFTITLLFQVNVIYMFCAFSLHFAPSSPSSVFCQHCCW